MGWAQHSVSGIVKDAEGVSIPGATVMESGTSNGTVTDIDGKYSLKVANKDALLSISFIGFITAEVSVNGQSKINIILEQDVKELEEVVVVGYGSVRKSDLTGAVASIKVEENVARQSSTIDQLLQGRAAGVQVTGGGQPGAGVSVRIRGTNSLRGNNEPLYVVDGIIISSAGEDAASASSDGNAMQVNQNGLNGINPRDIESIEVLKDASATAIYGSRGANGVILITTKKGSKGSAKVNGYVTTSVTSVRKKIDVLNGVDYAQYQNESNIINGDNVTYHIDGDEVFPINYGTYGASVADTAVQQVNWQDDLLQQATDLNAGISISGGSDRGSYYISGGYNKQGGIVESSIYQTADLRINLTQNVAEKLKVDARFNAFYGEGNFAQDGDRAGGSNRSFVNNIILTRPLYYGDFEQYVIDNEISSPYSFVNDFEDATKESRFVGRLGLTYDLPIKGLKYEINAGGNIRLKERNRWYGVTTWQGGTANGSLSLSDLEAKSYQINNLLRYSKNGKTHRIQVVLGNTIDGRDVANSIYEVQDFVTKSFTVDQPFFGQNVTRPLEIRYSPTNIISYLGRVNYTFKNKYVLTSSFRYDGVSKFKGDNKWSFFPSFALAWNAAEESFVQGLNLFDELKVRTGWGQIGNHGIQPFQTLANYGGELYATLGNGTTVAFVPLNIPNQSLIWETTEQLNAGIDFGVWDNRITGTADYYIKTTKDLLQYAAIGPSNGFETISSNRGEIQNSGLEFLINGVLIDKGDLGLNIGGNIAFNRNKIQSLGIPESNIYINGVEEQRSFYYGDNVSTGTYFKSPANVFMEGEPVGLFVGYETDGIYQSTDEITVDGAQPGDIKIIDQNGDNVIDTNDRTIIGDPNPDFVYGINLSARYKRFSLNILINGVQGNEIANGTFVRLGTADANQTNIIPAAYHGAWRPERETNLYPRIGYTGENSASAVTDRIIEDGSFVRLGNVTLNYDVPVESVKGISSLNFYAAGRNLLTLTSYRGYDPEISSFLYNGNIIGVDWTGVPNTMSITLGANITF